jgi:phage shock protein PspC (stress-responsive transcriptional regulator)
MILGAFEIPIWIITILFFTGILFFVWLWAVIDCLNSNHSTNQKIFWIIVIIFVPVVGIIMYAIFSKAMHEHIDHSIKRHIKIFEKVKDDKMIAGVCGGFGEYLNIDPTIIRIIWIVFTTEGLIIAAILLNFLNELAYHVGFEPGLLKIVIITLGMINVFMGVFLYLIFWMMMPKEGEKKSNTINNTNNKTNQHKIEIVDMPKKIKISKKEIKNKITKK